MGLSLKEIPVIHTSFWKEQHPVRIHPKEEQGRRRWRQDEHNDTHAACAQDGPLSDLCALHNRNKRKMCDAPTQRHGSDAHTSSLNKTERRLKRRRRSWPGPYPSHTRTDDAGAEEEDGVSTDSEVPSPELNILHHLGITQNEHSTLLGLLFHGDEDEEVTSPGHDPPLSESQTPDEPRQPSTPPTWTHHQPPCKQPTEEEEYLRFEEWIWSSYDDLRDWMKGAPVDVRMDFNVV